MFAQDKSVNDFKKEFEKIVNSNLTEEQLNKLFQEYPLILSPHSDTTQLFESVKGTKFEDYSMVNFKNENLYKANIDNFLNSENSYKRILAYLLIASTNDFSKESILLEKIKTETSKGNLIWSGMALLSIKSKNTDEIFDFLIKNENFGDAHMLPMYIRLDKDSLRETAYRKINSDDDKAKVLAVQSLAVTANNSKTELIVKNSVREWDLNLKGYAIYTLKELEIGNLLETLKPLLDNKKTRKISLEALANSPTLEDQQYLKMELNKNNLDEDILDALYKSKNIENLRIWLLELQKKDIPKDYYFSVFDQPIFRQDEILPDLHNALQKINNKDILGELVRALHGKTDKKSIDLMLKLLKNKSSTVRYWTAKTLEDNPSQMLRTKENQKLLKNGLEDGNNPD